MRRMTERDQAARTVTEEGKHRAACRKALWGDASGPPEGRRYSAVPAAARAVWHALSEMRCLPNGDHKPGEWTVATGWSNLAKAAGCTDMAARRNVLDLEANGWLRVENWPGRGTHAAGTFVLTVSPDPRTWQTTVHRQLERAEAARRKERSIEKRVKERIGKPSHPAHSLDGSESHPAHSLDGSESHPAHSLDGSESHPTSARDECAHSLDETDVSAGQAACAPGYGVTVTTPFTTKTPLQGASPPAPPTNAPAALDPPSRPTSPPQSLALPAGATWVGPEPVDDVSGGERTDLMSEHQPQDVRAGVRADRDDPSIQDKVDDAIMRKALCGDRLSRSEMARYRQLARERDPMRRLLGDTPGTIRA